MVQCHQKQTAERTWVGRPEQQITPLQVPGPRCHCRLTSLGVHLTHLTPHGIPSFYYNVQCVCEKLNLLLEMRSSNAP